MKDNVLCEACREKIFRLTQEEHPSEKMRSIYLTLNRINRDMELLKTKLQDQAVEDMFTPCP